MELFTRESGGMTSHMEMEHSFQEMARLSNVDLIMELLLVPAKRMDLLLLLAKLKYLWLMAPIMMAIGKTIKEMDMESIIIQMAIAMKAHGVMIVECKMENSILPLVPSILANLLMMKLMEAHLDFLKTNLRLNLNCLTLKMIKAKVFQAIFPMDVCKKNVKPISRMEINFKECF